MLSREEGRLLLEIHAATVLPDDECVEATGKPGEDDKYKAILSKINLLSEAVQNQGVMLAAQHSYIKNINDVVMQGEVNIIPILGIHTRLLQKLVNQLTEIKKLENKQMGKIDDILAEVDELDDINDSLDLLFAKLQELILAGATDPAKLQQAIDIISTQKARTKAAIVAHTPADPGNGEEPVGP